MLCFRNNATGNKVRAWGKTPLGITILNIGEDYAKMIKKNDLLGWQVGWIKLCCIFFIFFGLNCLHFPKLN